ncbi:hypothetical protein [Pseudofrankia sp. BMG5.36]|uniref:hypothetical protein n=1 Tax=Pseudofrankia sp. BMG5.36 TaxID=1834512 RepID=UPI0008D970A4|nr:hypothetical protein [Pseudofrankia sp. BMG5.36]OHV75224.1 hypothetical protein BCD48_00385 [Pseudofrankia sp. BMG5.36]
MTRPRQTGGSRSTRAEGHRGECADRPRRQHGSGAETPGSAQAAQARRSPVAEYEAGIPAPANGTSVHHFPDHRDFLKVYEPATGDSADLLDAVIVPTVRPAKHLDTAAQIASGASRRLIVLCSREARAVEVRARFDSTQAEVTAIDIPPGYWHPTLDFATSSEIFMRLSPTPVPRDLSLKRNLGLLIARLSGWRKIVFMDDDIYGIDPGGLLRASAALNSNRASCFLVESPEGPADSLPTEDNSAVCHALRLVGGKQNVFASGSALGVNCSEEISLFPNIYNEDFFFLLRETRRSGITRVGFVRQREYNPFLPERARYEEFGDVLAEGLLASLHLGKSELPTTEYWKKFLAARSALLHEIRAGLSTSDSQYAANATEAVKAAQRQLRSVTPDACTEYLTRFDQDRRAWARRLGALPRLNDMALTLGFLGLG